MSMNPLNDISSVYMQEVLKPQLGEKKPEAAPQQKSEGGGESGGSDKKVRQAVYDIRYRARREDVPLPQAFSQYMSNTSMSAPEKKAVKEKLGIGPGGQSSVSEEADQKKFQVRVKDKLSGSSYVRMATREKINQLRANPNISSVEMTKYGTPYEGEKKKGKATADVTSGKGLAKKDYDGDGKIESGSKEHAGAVHNAIQRKKGGKPDGQDTRKEEVEISEIHAQAHKPHEVPTGKLKDLVKKAVKRIDTDVDGDTDNNDKAKGELGEFIPGVGNKRLYSTTKTTTAKESFSNWRNDLREVVGEIPDGSDKKKVKEKKVDNYSGKEKCVDLNPQLGEAAKNLGCEIIEMVEIDEKITAKTDMGTAIKDFYGSKSPQLAGRTKEERRKAAIAAVLTARRGGKKLGEAVSQIPGKEKNPPSGTTAKQDDVQRKQMLANKQKMMQKKMMLQRQQLQLQKQGKLPMGHAVEEVEYEIEEGMTLKDYKKKRSALKQKEKRAADKIAPNRRAGIHADKASPERAARHRANVDPDFEGNDERNYPGGKLNPKKVRKAKALGELGEAVYGGEKQEPKDTRYTVTAADKKGNTTAYQKYKAGDKRYKAADHLGEEMIDELNRAERETGINTKTGKPTAKGGAKDDKAFTHVKRMMRSQTGKPAGQRKKEPGKKPPVAGSYGAPKSPAQKVAAKRAAAKRAQDNMSSRFD